MKDVQVKKIIEVSVSNQQLVAKTPCRLVAGTRGLYAVRVTYDDEWNETPHILLQFNGCKTKEVDIRDASEPIDVPWECIEEACYLSLALLGMDGNGELKLTTYSRNNNSLIVYPKDWRDKGEDDEDRDPLPPTPTIWEDLKEQLSEKADAEDVEKAIGELEEEIAKKADAQEVNNKFSGIEEQLNKKVGSEELTNAIDDLSNDIQKDFEAIEDELDKKVSSEDIQDILDDIDNTIQEGIKEIDNKIDTKADSETVNIGFENISKQLANKADAKTVQDGFDGLEEEIRKKADAETVQNSLNGLGTEIAKKADSETVQSSLNELSAEVAKKANTESVQGVIDEISGDLEKCAEAILKVNDDVNNKADVIINNVGGEEIAVYDSKETAPNIKTFGKSIQVQYTGSQLFDMNAVTGSNITSRVNDNTLTLTANVAKTWCQTNQMVIKNCTAGESVNITISAKRVASSNNSHSPTMIIRGVNPNDKSDVVTLANRSLLSLPYTLTKTIDDTHTQLTVVLSLNNASTTTEIGDTVVFEELMVVSGTKAISYEPFTGGVSVPNPGHKQEINDIGSNGNINITCSGKNFIPYPYFQNTVTQYGVTFTAQADGGIAGSGTATNAVGITIYDGAVLGKGIVTASLSGTFSNMVWSITLYDESNVKIVTHQNKALLTFNLDDYPTAKRMVMMVKRSSNAAVKGVAYPQLELGETATSYSKNIESQTLTLSTPNGLSGIPLGATIPSVIASSPIHMSGVYWDDATSQYYIADTKNENGKDIQRIWKGNPKIPIVFTSQNSSGRCQVFSTKIFGITFMNGTVPSMSTIARWSEYGNTNKTFAVVTDGCYYNDSTKTLDEVNALFAELGTDIEFVSVLAEPIVTDVSEEELAQYNALHMNYPNTSIINDSGAYIDVEYVADTKSYIDNTQGNQGSEEIDIKLDGLESEMDNKANIDDVEIAFTQLENEIDKKATITEVQEIENKVNKNTEDIKQLSEKTNAIINIASGASISVYDSSNATPNIKTYGKSTQNQYEGNQLIDINNIGELTKNGVTLSKDGDYISIQGSGTYTNIDFDIPCIIPNGAKVYFYLLEGDRTNMTFYFRNADKLLVNGSVINPNGVYTVSDEVAYFRITCKEANYSTKLKIMITTKENATYEPFVGNKPSPSPESPQDVVPSGNSGSINCTIDEQEFTLSTPNGLRGIPLGTTIQSVIANSPIHMSGVYWDEAEQQYYIADTKNENGKDVQRIKRILVKTIYNYSTGEKFGGIPVSDMLVMPSIREPIISTHFKFAKSTRADGDCFGYGQQLRLYYDVESKEAFEEWLAENEVYAEYILAKPIVTDVTEEELAQYQSVHMNYPSTTIINDADAYMEVEYAADTKNYIDNKFAELKTAMVALGGAI